MLSEVNGKIFDVDFRLLLCRKRSPKGDKADGKIKKRHRKTECMEHSVKGYDVFIV